MVVTRYVNTASTAGGDGTTNEITGDNRAFASLNEAEASIPATISDYWDIICEGSAADTAKPTFSGTITTAEYYIQVRTDPNASSGYGRHEGIWSTSKYRLEQSASSSTIAVTENYVKFIGLQVYSGKATDYAYVIALDGITGAGLIEILDCIIKEQTATPVEYMMGVYLAAASAAISCNIRNNIIQDIYPTTAGAYNGGIYVMDSDWTLNADNNTFYNCKYGINKGAGIANAINNVVRVTTDGYVGTFSGTSDYNSSDISGDAPVQSPRDNTESPWYSGATADSAIFVDATNDDFHLLSDAIFVDVGYDLSGTFTDDIDGDTRSGTWDIGADEYVAEEEELNYGTLLMMKMIT